VNKFADVMPAQHRRRAVEAADPCQTFATSTSLRIDFFHLHTLSVCRHYRN